MQLCNEGKLKSSRLSKKMSKLYQEFSRQIELASTGKNFEILEDEIHESIRQLECLVLAEILQKYDIKNTNFMYEQKEYHEVLRSKKSYQTSVGKIEIEQGYYRSGRAGKTLCPLALRAGVVEGNWTPRAAQHALYTVSHLTPYAAEELFGCLGGMKPSKSSLDRLPKKVNRCWEEKREEFEKQIRQQEAVPKEATTLAVSLDGILLRIQGNRIIPGDSAYQEVGCGALIFYDSKGEPLEVRRYGRMPEQKKKTLKKQLRKDLIHYLSLAPQLRLAKVADGARDNWTFLQNDLPKGVEVLDFYHAAEHLKTAFDGAYGENTLKSLKAFKRARKRLLEDEGGCQKIIRQLRGLHRQWPKSKKISEQLTYFKNHQHQCHYARLKKQNFPIGSGIIEASCKTLVTQRMKQSGMEWLPQGGQAILTLRAMLQSKRFEHYWRIIANLYQGEITIGSKEKEKLVWKKVA